MPDNKIKIVIVDTNCFIRLFHSSVKPIFGMDIGGYRLLTLGCLVDEYLLSPNLKSSFPWIAQEPRLSELKNSKLKLKASNKTATQNQIKSLKPYAKSLLTLHCNKQGIGVKSLSKSDLELLATTVAISCIMATDEWPLRLVAKDLMEDPAEYKIGLLNSLELLHILEINGKIDSEERRNTVDAWIRNSEKESADKLGM